MTTRTKTIGVALLLLVGWYLYAQGDDAPAPATSQNADATPDDPDGTVTASSLVVESGQCVRVDFYASGRHTNTVVPMATCCADNPGFSACAPTDSSGVDAFPFSLPPKE